MTQAQHENMKEILEERRKHCGVDSKKGHEPSFLPDDLEPYLDGTRRLPKRGIIRWCQRCYKAHKITSTQLQKELSNG